MSFVRLLLPGLGLLAMTTACGPSPSAEAAVLPGQPQRPEARVLVVYNAANTDSVKLAKAYVSKRGIPLENQAILSTSAAEETPENSFRIEILQPVMKKIAELRTQIDFIVLCKGVPIRIREGGFSVDAMLAAPNFRSQLVREEPPIELFPNPYYGKKEPFSSRKFGFYLVTRLDGYDFVQAQKLIDNSLAAKPDKGLFFFDVKEKSKSTAAYAELNESTAKAGAALRARGMEVEMHHDPAYGLAPAPVMGYVTWGSNDSAFDVAKYRKTRFKPGAICETFVSTSARSFYRQTTGQSMIADLIENGVTGVKGYVSEPFTLALARPEILFDRYTTGYNLAESFYMASPVLRWKDLVIGDPLCAPYKK